MKDGCLLNFKHFKDGEARVLDVVEHIHDGVGALRVRDVQTGAVFELGTGFKARNAPSFGVILHWGVWQSTNTSQWAQRINRAVPCFWAGGSGWTRGELFALRSPLFDGRLVSDYD